MPHHQTAAPITLRTGAELRLTGPTGGPTVICLSGGQQRQAPGTWTASYEWLLGRLAPQFPHLQFGEVRYRVKSWEVIELCVEDARAAVEKTAAERTLFVGFSMGGAVAISAADEPSVVGVVGLAPWTPEQLSVEALRGKRLDVIHGSFDGWIPGIPGVRPAVSRRGLDRAQAIGVEGSYTLIRGAMHGIALRGPGGRPIPLPRAHTWARLVAGRLDAFSS